MSVAFQHRSFTVDDPYARIGGDDDHDDHDDDHEMNKYINTEANVDDMNELAAATYIHEAHDLSVSREPSCQHDDAGDAPSPFKITESTASHHDHDLDQAPPNVDPSKVPINGVVSPPRLHSGEFLLDGAATLDCRPQYPTMPRSKAVEKPSRTVTKNEAGMFECRWPDCKEDFKMFSRKCEWSKHMDKHERPYICTVKGCEKIQGFTYSGGLLRHEREVHGKHGGPKKAFNCPHANCKRHKGKGFSRLENLQEHLRRVHTPNSSTGTTLEPSDEGIADAAAAILNQRHSPMSDSASDVASAAFAVITGMDASPGNNTFDDGVGFNNKRKRSVEDDGQHAGIKMAMLEENATLRQENDELRRQCQELRSQLEAYQAQVNGAVQAAISAQAAITALAVPPPPPGL